MFGCNIYDIYNGNGQRVGTVEAVNGRRAKMAWAMRCGYDCDGEIRTCFKAVRRK